MAKTALSPDADTLALLAALGAQPLTRIATVTGAGCAVLAALHQRDGAEVLLIDLGEGGRFGRADWPEACRDLLLALGVDAKAIRLIRRAEDLVPADLVLNLQGFGDRLKIRHLDAVIPALLAPQGRIVSDIRKGSGGWAALKAHGTVEELSKTRGEVVVARTLLTRATTPTAPPTATPAATPVPPAESDWAGIARTLMGPDGFYTDNGAHSFLFVPRDPDTLVVTFDNLDIALEKREDRRPWGFSFIEKNGWSMLGVMANGWTWYRDPWVGDEFDRLAAEGFFARFRRVVFYGASMGGYAAAVFSAACPGAEVVAIAPQSTLDKQIVPWETRYKVAWDKDFSGKYGDAAEASRAAGRVVLLYDPYERLDAGHADRFTGDNVLKLRAPLLGHRLGSSLQQMGILAPITVGALAGTLSAPEFYRMIRARKSFGRYQKELFKRALKMGRPGLARRLGRFVLTRGDHRWIRKEMANL